MTKPHLFHLQRDTDITGVSGTGRVADGVIWPDGTATRIVLDDNPEARLGRIAAAHVPETFPGGLVSGLCVECEQKYPCPTYTWATTERDPLATWDPADDDTEEQSR